MHVADRRHGLDVVATLRKDGAADDDLLVAGLLHDAGKGHTGVVPRVAYALGQAYGAWVWRVAGLVPGWRPGSARLRDHAEISARLAGEAGCSARTVELIRHQDARWTPTPGAHSSSPTRPTDGHGRDRITGVPVMAPGATAVRIGDGRPESSTHVQVATFDGPLALLLSLIEARQLDVLTVPLGGLADAYLEALAGLEADRLGNVSAFVAVASQLILIKSRAMLPRPPAIEPGSPDGR